MIPTKTYIEQKFEAFNRSMFKGSLPPIPILMSNAKTFLGKCVYKKRRGRHGKTEYYDFRLRINTRADLPEEEVEDTLIHEMIHYYICVNQLEDASAHGPVFQHIMNTINDRFGRHITVSFKGTKEQRDQFVDQRQRYHVVAVVGFRDGKAGIKVLPRILERILHYYNTVSSVKEVETVRLYMSNDVYFNRFPNSSALKVHYVDKEELSEHLKAAKRLQCNGREIVEI